MNWVIVAWSMVASACLTLAVIHLLAWFSGRERLEYLAFTTVAAAAGIVTLMEMAAMQAVSVAQMIELHRWVHVPSLLIYIGQIWFVRVYFGVGRMALGYAIVATRAVLALFSVVSGGLYFVEIEGLRHATLPGGAVISLPLGGLSLLHLFDCLTLGAMMLFLADAARTVRARPQAYHRALWLLWAFSFFTFLILVHIPLIHLNLANLPYMVGWSFMPTLIVMAHLMSTDLLQTARLAEELRASEMRLRESERRLSLAVDAGGIALWMWDREGTALWCNDHARRLLNAGDDTSVNLGDLLANAHPDDIRQLERAMRAPSGTALFELELRVPSPTGGVRWLVVRGAPEVMDGTSTLVRGAAIDITARRELEQESRALRDELAHLSRVTMLGELSGAIAHELNQPLAAILSNTQAAQRFLARGPEALEEVKEILADIVAEDRRASEVIYRLRTLLRKGELDLKSEGVNEMVQDVLRILRSDMINRKVNLVTAFNDVDLTVQAARVQVQQVLVNLVINACDALSQVPASDRILTIRTGPHGEGFAAVTVEDNGPGIPAESITRIFEPFFTTKEHGMGLGLSVCRTIVLAHGGMLWADADVHRGAIINFTLPLARS